MPKPESGTAAVEEEEEYVVEKVLGKRIKKGRVEYFLKWVGFGEADNTWEPSDNLNCKELIEGYEKKNAVSTQPDAKKKKADGEAIAPKKKKTHVTGWDRGMEAEEILGATETDNQIYFLVKWKGVNDAELVLSKVANEKIPQLVIGFYEARLTWSSSKTSESAAPVEEALEKEEKEPVAS